MRVRRFYESGEVSSRAERAVRAAQYRVARAEHLLLRKKAVELGLDPDSCTPEDLSILATDDDGKLLVYDELHLATARLEQENEAD